MSADLLLTRRRFLLLSAAGSALAVAACKGTTPTAPPPSPTVTPTAASSPAASGPGAATVLPYDRFRTRNDFDGAPRAQLLSSTVAASPGYLLVTPFGATSSGPAIFDNAGHLVWYEPHPGELVHNFQLVNVGGQQLLSWYEGTELNGAPGASVGDVVFADGSYRQVKRIGQDIDLHEFLVTSYGTAFVDAYVPVVRDLTAFGGIPDTTVNDWVMEEVDLASGAVLWSWSALDHVPYDESTEPPPLQPGAVYDYFHGNSIELDSDGNLIVSARNTCAIYKVDHATGKIRWRISGNPATSSLPETLELLPAGESFWYQHDARRNLDGTISLFDDGGTPYMHDARAIVLEVDEAQGTATVRKTFGLPVQSGFMGSMRRLPSGNWLVGWGNIPRVTEFADDGAVVLDMALSSYSYRVVRAQWTGIPEFPPDVAAERTGNLVAVWASWNGSTEVRSWRVLAVEDGQQTALATVPWADFETMIAVRTEASAVAVEALDGEGNVLGTSQPAYLYT